MPRYYFDFSSDALSNPDRVGMTLSGVSQAIHEAEETMTLLHRSELNGTASVLTMDIRDDEGELVATVVAVNAMLPLDFPS